MEYNERRWQCINGCNTFQMVGIPQFCPMCKSRELYPQEKDEQMYDNPDKQFTG